MFCRILSYRGCVIHCRCRMVPKHGPDLLVSGSEGYICLTVRAPGIYCMTTPSPYAQSQPVRRAPSHTLLRFRRRLESLRVVTWSCLIVWVRAYPEDVPVFVSLSLALYLFCVVSVPGGRTDRRTQAEPAPGAAGIRVCILRQRTAR